MQQALQAVWAADCCTVGGRMQHAVVLADANMSLELFAQSVSEFYNAAPPSTQAWDVGCPLYQ